MANIRTAAALSISAIILISCASAPDTEPMAGQDPPPAVPQETSSDSTVFPLTGDYSLESLMKVMIRVERFVMSVDTYQALSESDRMYEQDLERLFGLGFGPYATGEGTRVRTVARNGQEEEFRMGVISETDGARWWKVEYLSPSLDVDYEVKIEEPGIPVAVRFRDSSGEWAEYATLIAESYYSALEEMGEEELNSAVEAENNRKFRDQLYLMEGAEISGEVIVETPAGSFETVHVTRPVGSNALHYWISPDVPGQLVRLAAAANPNPEEILWEIMEVFRY